jgi:hypothetical protein
LEDVYAKNKRQGGEKMRAENMLTIVATMGVIVAFIAYPFDLLFISSMGLAIGYPLSFIVYLFFSALVGGLVFAGNFQDSRMKTITKVTVVWGLLWMVLATIVPAFSEYGGYARAAYSGQYGSVLSAAEQANWQSVFAEMFGEITVIVAVLTCFTGLYAGSILRQRKKT